MYQKNQIHNLYCLINHNDHNYDLMNHYRIRVITIRCIRSIYIMNIIIIHIIYYYIQYITYTMAIGGNGDMAKMYILQNNSNISIDT